MERVVRTGPTIAGWCLVLFLAGCAGSRSESVVAQYGFDVEGAFYRIRSIDGGSRDASYNELVGPNVVAADLDQDGVVDRIVMGAMSLADAQAVYAVGLDRLARAGRLREAPWAGRRFTWETAAHRTEVRSYRPAGAPPFNEFEVRGRPGSTAMVFLDREADGVLDEVLRGSASLREVQSLYDETIRAGLRRGALVRAGRQVLVRE